MGVNVSPTDYVLKVYMTEADALANTNPLGVMSATLGGLSHDTADVNASATVATAHSSHTDGYYHFFIFEEYWFRIEANGLVKEFEIDWDDGEDNTPEKSNTSKLVLENPNAFAVTSHIFSKHGPHFPLIRTKSVEGFYSKWYTPAHEDNDFKALDDSHRVDSNLYDAGNNNFSMVTMEKKLKPRIPILCPANKPPVCVLKTDRKQIFSGIDNTFLGDVSIDDATYPQVVIHSENANRSNVYLRILYLDSGAPTGSADAGDNTLIREVKKKHGETINACRRILRVELIDNRETTSATASDKLASGERIHILHDAQGAGENVSIAYVSLGNPILEDYTLGFYATIDATESRTRASNVTLATTDAFMFDLDRDRVWTGGMDVRQTTSSDSYGNTPYMTQNTAFGPTSDGVRRESYSHSFTFNMLDDDNRFLPEGRLIECQVRDSSASTQADDAFAGADNDIVDKNQLSFLEHFEGKTYWNGDTDDDGTIESDSSNCYRLRNPSDLKSFSIMYRTYDGDTGTPTWTDCSNLINSDTAANGTLRGSSLSGTSITTGNYKTYLLIAKDRKFDKIYMKTLHDDISAIFNNISIQGATDGNWPAIELQLFYPSVEKGFTDTTNYIRFKPLKFMDNTTFNRKRGTSLCRSGMLSFDPPNDWVKCKKTTMNSNLGTDNFLNNLANPWDVDSYAICIAIGIDASSGAGADTALAKVQVPKVLVADNSHQQYIEVIDPTCLSLNNLVLAQGISFNRKGKYQVIENRLGMAEIRKIGASGGVVKFGGVDLQNDVNSTRDTVYRYQKEATPVFLDVTHKNGDYTRFYGTIIEMSEDHPTGGMLPKYGLSLQVSSVAMFNSSGGFVSEGLVSLGGEIDKPRFVGFGGHL